MIIPRYGRSSTNYPGIIDFKGKSYLFYHNDLLPGGDHYHRSVYVKEFKYNDDGTIPAIELETYAGTVELLNSDVADGCHANSAGEQSLGYQTIEKFGR